MKILFVIFSFFFGLITIFLNPPFQVADEPSHFYRAIQLAEGVLKGEIRPAEIPPGSGIIDTSGDEIPLDFVKLEKLSSGVPFSFNSKVDGKKIFETLMSGPYLGNERVFQIFSNTELYSPSLYWSSVIGVWSGMKLKPSPLIIFYMGRITTLIVCTLIGLLTLHLLPNFQWSFFLLFFTPLNITLRSSYSADALLIAYTFCYFALLIRLAEKKNVENWERYLLFLLVVLLALSKQFYFLLFALLPFVPRLKKSFVFILLASAGLVLVGWGLYIKDIYVVTRFDHQHHFIHPDQQLPFIINNPLFFLKLLFQFYRDNFVTLGHQMVGHLGWLDNPMPSFYRILSFFLLTFLPLMEGMRSTWMVRIRDKFLIFSLFLSSLLLIGVAMYLSWTALKSPVVEGIAGRYFIPYFPWLFLFLSFPALKKTKLSLGQKFVPWVSVIGALVLGFKTFHMLYIRYY